MHRLFWWNDWMWPGAIIGASLMHISARPLMAQATPPPLGGSFDLATAQWIAIGTAIVGVVAKLGELAMKGYKEYRQIQDQSGAGKLAACLAECELVKQTYAREMAVRDDEYNRTIQLLNAAHENAAKLQEVVNRLTRALADLAQAESDPREDAKTTS